MAYISKLLLLCLFFFLLYFPLIYSSLLSNFSSNLCDKTEATILLQFKNSVIIDPDSPMSSLYAKTRSWKKGTDCCQWDGVTCDPLAGHVIGLDLSYSQFIGPMTSNNSIFRLHHLQSLNLGYNNFNSCIPQELGLLSRLEYLNLSDSGFFGNVPLKIAQLSQLRTLDLSYSPIAMPNFGEIIANLTELKVLSLSAVAIDSIVPQSLSNLSSLTSLRLTLCGLQGKFPDNILQLPNLRVLDVSDNKLLYANFTRSSNWSSPLEVLRLEKCSFSGRLPDSLPHPESLRDFSVGYCNFHGKIPTWVWNITEAMNLDYNHFNGELPSAINIGSSSLTSINLYYNSLSGMLPSWLFNLPSLRELHLRGNQFSGELNHTNSSNNLLNTIDLSFNKIYGSIPMAIFGLTSLTQLDLGSNKLSGSIELDRFSKLKNLSFLTLSANNLSVITTKEDANFTITWPQLRLLHLSFCNITEFPSFLRSQENLFSLDLSNNNIQGEVPKWLHNMGNESMNYLDLSQNSLTGGLEDLRSWPNLQFIILHANRLQGPMPILPFDVLIFSASNNRLTGEIPLSICDLTIFLVFLDLSYNRLSGEIPQCMGDFRTLEWLNLCSNNLHGSIPWTFGINNPLTTLVLNGNRFEGRLPRSLVNCTYLNLLDLGNNKFNDTFPDWLGALQGLRILILHSNNFHGRVRTSKEQQPPFPMLQILDLHDNSFKGIFPSRLLNDFKAMIRDDGKDDVLQYIGVDIPNGFELPFEDRISGYSAVRDSIALTFKGIDRELNGILTTLVAIDLSSNRFRGAIPNSIGELVSMRWLNLSHNNFTGSIPPSLENLSVIESLDLSSNQLTGKIPKELVNLHFLVNFSVADNKLDGAIPHGGQFDLFENSSYLGNIGLCGAPLSKKCGKDGSLLPQPPPAENNPPSTDLDEWKIILMGYGCGLVIGLIAGYYIFLARTPVWLLKLMCRIKLFMARPSN